MNDQFRNIKPEQSRILLLEGGPRVLPTYSEELSRKAEQQLNRLGVEVRTSNMVTLIEPGAVWVKDERIPAAVILWAAGVAASPLGESWVFPLIAPDASSCSPISASRDIARCSSSATWPHSPTSMARCCQESHRLRSSKATGWPIPLRAIFEASREASFTTTIRAAWPPSDARPPSPRFPKFPLSGYFAWLAWLFIHILFLIGFRNRLIVMINWAWAYLTYERGARLITGSNDLPGWNSSRRTSSSRNEAAQDATAQQERTAEPPASTRGGASDLCCSLPI